MLNARCFPSQYPQPIADRGTDAILGGRFQTTTSPHTQKTAPTHFSALDLPLHRSTPSDAFLGSPFSARSSRLAFFGSLFSARSFRFAPSQCAFLRIPLPHPPPPTSTLFAVS